MATYSLKMDKNKIMVGMIRRAQKGDFDAIVDIVAALLVDEDGRKVERSEAVRYADSLSLEQLDELATELQGAFTPKVN